LRRRSSEWAIAGVVYHRATGNDPIPSGFFNCQMSSWRGAWIAGQDDRPRRADATRRPDRNRTENEVEIARACDLSGYLQPKSAAFATGVSWEVKMNEIDSKRPHVGMASVSVDRTLTEMQQLEAMAAKLLETARKLPAGPVCRDILEEIGKFGVRIAALKAKGR
jgi:hypothetical protein